METLETPKPMGWDKEGQRVVSTGTTAAAVSSNRSPNETTAPLSVSSNELYALMNFAHRLGAVVKNNDPSFIDDTGVRREAKLLMSLSSGGPARHKNDSKGCSVHSEHLGVIPNRECCSTDRRPPSTFTSFSSGRITPQSVTSANSGGSKIRLETFCFTCPSLSLESKEHEMIGEASGEDAVDSSSKDKTDSSTTVYRCPAVMLGRTLKVEDMDALRLSSDAMARNIMQSFQKAMNWRIQSWINCLSAVLIEREQDLQANHLQHQEVDTNELVNSLYYSNEALLVAALRQIESKIQVLETSTAFKVLHKISSATEGANYKKQRPVEEEKEDEEVPLALEVGEYVYDVLHVLEMQCALTISCPAGNVNIDLNVPGIIKGTFLSSEDALLEELTDVNIHVNTAMLATMIERSSRIAVRCSVEAMFKGESVDSKDEDVKMASGNKVFTASPSRVSLPPKTSFISPHATSTRSPKRKLSEEDVSHPVSGLVVITPASRDASSPSDFADSDSDGDGNSKDIALQIPDNFHRKPTGAVLFPHTSRGGIAHGSTSDLSFASRLPPKKSYKAKSSAERVVVTPMKTSRPEFERRDSGPVVPLLELASAASFDKKVKI